jgi:ubiquinone/menaquinone biosynthesis C-methylase UbiE
MNVQEQKLVNWHFDKVAPYWAQVYERSDDVYSCIYQNRLRIVLDLVSKSGLPMHTHALDIGCGAGYATVALARQGYDVDAVDAVQTMVDSTRDLVAKAGVEERVRISRGDVHTLPFPEETFDLVVAMGVLPWLPSMEEPVREMCRVLRPGGYLIITVDNRWGLRQFLDPLANPLLRPVKEATKAVLRWSNQLKERPRPRRTSIWGCDALLDAEGLEKLDGVTLGFGPFTLFGQRLLPHSLGVKVHRSLQDLADRAVPFICSRGAEYVVRARKRSVA